MTSLTAGTLQDIREGQYEVQRRDLERLLGRRPMDLRAMLERALAEGGPRPRT